jgi:hypothetical protein
MAGVDLWRAKLPKVAAEGGIGPPPPSLAASVAAPLEDNYTLRAAKVHSRSRDGSSVGDALRQTEEVEESNPRKVEGGKEAKEIIKSK